MNNKYKDFATFVRENRDLINNNNFYEVYLNLDYSENISLFSQLLLEAGINPLLHLNEVIDYFLYKSDIVDFEIPNNIQWIDVYAFSYCTKLKSITMYNSVKNIQSYAFEHCNNLEKIIFSDNITDIYYRGFIDCWKLDNLVFPKKLKNIDEEAFRNCKNLHEITLYQDFVKASSDSFDNCPLDSIIYKGTSKQWIENVQFYPSKKLTVHCLDKDIQV